MHDFKYIKEEKSVLNLLYIESKDEFRLEISDLLKEFFSNIYVSNSDDESIDMFTKHHPEVIIMDIDIHVYYFNWLEIARHIKEIHPEIKIIILSTNDDKKTLLDAIDVGVTKFLIKPVSHHKLSDVLMFIKTKLDYEHNTKIFYTNIHSVFNYKKSIIIMLKNKKPLLVNQVFLDFFGVESIREFTNKHKDLGALFLRHDGYLYNKAARHWLDEVKKDFDKTYNVELKNTNSERRHFLFKYHKIPEKSYAIISLDDITELNLSKSKEDALEIEPVKKDIKSIFKLLKLLQKNKIKVHMYNYYKGLTIVHDALVVDVKNNSVTLKTDYFQQKAIQIEGKTLISSEVLPYTIACDKVSKISFEKQLISFEDLHFTRTSPATRKTIRLVPDSKYSISLIINKRKYISNIEISDISFDSIKLTFDYVPINLYLNDKVLIDMVLIYNKKPLIINTKATVVKEASAKHNSSMSFAFDLDEKKKDIMLKYISARQIEIIKEFKALKNKTVQ